MKATPTLLEPKSFAKDWLRMRHLGRTDLEWLCVNVLGFKDVVRHAHGPILESVQKFPGRNESVDENFNVQDNGPLIPLWDLNGPRDHLILYPRGHLKTTINCIAHGIQWILNYPDVRILITTATELLAKEIMQAFQKHFTVNDVFRSLYPEYCAPIGKQIGNSEQFTVPNRSEWGRTLMEPTAQIITVTSAMAGIRADVIKHSDVIDIINSRTPGGVETTKQHFAMCLPLLERKHDSNGNPSRAWRTIEGTVYSYADYHAEMLERLQKDPDHKWILTHRSCWTDKTKSASIWPERFGVEDLLETKREMGDELFANQYELNPIPEGTGLASVEQFEKTRIDRDTLEKLLPRLRLHVTIDLAGLEKESTGDYTVITLAGFGRDGRMYVLEIFRGHYDGHEVTDILFDLDQKYQHKILDFKVEKEGHARGLKSTLEIKQAQRERFLNIAYLPRDTRISKIERIKYSLRYWFVNGRIRIATDLDCWDELRDEVLRFPKWKHDDILDTLVDQTQNQSVGVETDIVPRAKPQMDVPWVPPRFTGFGFGGEPQFEGQGDDPTHFYHEKTGI